MIGLNPCNAIWSWPNVPVGICIVTSLRYIVVDKILATSLTQREWAGFPVKLRWLHELKLSIYKMIVINFSPPTCPVKAASKPCLKQLLKPCHWFESYWTLVQQNSRLVIEIKCNSSILMCCLCSFVKTLSSWARVVSAVHSPRASTWVIKRLVNSETNKKL